MNRHLVRFAASVTAVAVLSAAGTGLAVAGSRVDTQPTTAARTPDRIQALHDRLATASTTADPTALATALRDLGPALDALRATATPELADLLDRTAASAAEAGRVLPTTGGIDLVAGALALLLRLLEAVLGAVLAGLPVQPPPGPTTPPSPAQPSTTLPSTTLPSPPPTTVPTTTAPSTSAPSTSAPSTTSTEPTPPVSTHDSSGGESPASPLPGLAG